jgi:asparagine synthase (glutamine-hydrolysing)
MKFKLEKYLEGIKEKDMVNRHMRWLGTFPDEERLLLLRGDIWQQVKHVDPYADARRHYHESNAKDPLNKLLYLYQRSYMMDQVMVKVDRASMFASLEARAPFLDYELVEFVNRLPFKWKLHGFTGKYLLKVLMREKLPGSIVNRKKKGFGIPVGAWLRGPLKEWGSELLLGVNPKRDELFSRAYIEKLWSEHQSGTRDQRKKLWNLLVFLEWQKRY